jgi:hypothetical protein
MAESRNSRMTQIATPTASRRTGVEKANGNYTHRKIFQKKENNITFPPDHPVHSNSRFIGVFFVSNQQKRNLKCNPDTNEQCSISASLNVSLRDWKLVCHLHFSYFPPNIASFCSHNQTPLAGWVL